jgi:TP901 family phage tail tape measure protein
MAWNAGAMVGTARLNTGPFKKALTSLPPAAQTAMKAVGIAVGIATAAFVKTAFEANKFLKAFKNVTTITDDAVVDSKKLQKQILSLSSELGDATELTEGYYQAFSSGAKDQKQATRITVQSAKFAKAANTSVASSVDVLTTAINAYGEDVIDAEKASDLFFTTIKDGKIVGDELAASIGDSIPLYASMGIELEQLTSGLAAMTKQGVKANVATTQLNAIVNSFIKPSEAMTAAFKKYNIESGSALLETEGLVGALDFLEKATNGNKESLAELLPNIRAVKGSLALMGEGGKIFAETLVDMENAMGSTEVAFGKQEKTFDTFFNEFKNLQIEIGLITRPLVEDLVGIGTNTIKSAREAIRGLQAIFDPTIELTQATDKLTGFMDRYRKVVKELSKEESKNAKVKKSLLMLEKDLIGAGIAEALDKGIISYAKVTKQIKFNENAVKSLKKAQKGMFEALDTKNVEKIRKGWEGLQRSLGKATTVVTVKGGGGLLTGSSRKRVAEFIKTVTEGQTAAKKSLTEVSAAMVRYTEKQLAASKAQQEFVDTFAQGLIDRLPEARARLKALRAETGKYASFSVRNLKKVPKEFRSQVELLRRIDEAFIRLRKEVSKEFKIPKPEFAGVDTSKLTNKFKSSLLKSMRDGLDAVKEDFKDLRKSGLFDTSLAKEEVKALSQVLSVLKEKLGLSKKEAKEFIKQFENTSKARHAIDEVFKDPIEKNVDNVFNALDSIKRGAEVTSKEMGQAIMKTFQMFGSIAQSVFSDVSTTIGMFFDMQRNKVDAEINTMQAKVGELETELETVQGGISKLDSEIDALQNEIDSLSDQDEAETRGQQIKNELDELKAALEERQSIIDNDRALEQTALQEFTDGEFEIQLADYERQKALEEQKTEDQKTELEKRIDIKEAELADELARLNAEKSAKEQQRAADLANQKQIEKEKKDLEDEMRKKKSDAEKKAFDAEKGQKIAKIWMDFATATMGFWAAYGSIPFAGPIIAGSLTGVAAAVAGTQTGLVAAQKFIPSYQQGGTKQGDGLAFTDEVGPELKFLPDGTKIIPADLSREIAAASGRGNTTIINEFNNPVIDNEERMEQIVDMVDERLGANMKGAF